MSSPQDNEGFALRHLDAVRIDYDIDNPAPRSDNRPAYRT
jgi:hypothetical protein